LRKTLEDRGAALRIGASCHLADGLVIQQNFPFRRPCRFEIEFAPIEPDLIGWDGTIAELCDAPTHRDPAVPDPLFDAPARPESRGG
jgi:hypothetical protein